MVGRNELCPCGSGKKYEKCCLELHERVRRREALAESSGLPEHLGLRVFHRCGYSFDSRKEGWLHQGLRNSPDFVYKSENVYAYPDGEDIQAVLSVGKEQLGRTVAACLK